MTDPESDPETTANSQQHDGTDDEQPSDHDNDDDDDLTGHEQCHETVAPATRQKVLERDRYRCQTCGRTAPEAGGLATLHVHHIERDPEHLDEHDLPNLTTLCRSCHTWLHQRTTEDDAPVELSDADLRVLLPHDIEILRLLAEEGPASTGDIAAALTADLSVNAVRERLWVLMGLDNLVDGRDRQVVDQEVDTGEWGLVSQIGTSARGRIPNDPQLLLQRMADEQVRQALARGCNRETVADVLDVATRTTFYKEKRAHAYDFPLDALDGRGGRPAASDSQEDPVAGSTDQPASTAERDGQQRLDALAGGGPDERAGRAGEHGEGAPVADEQAGDTVEIWEAAVSGGETPAEELHGSIQEAIESLQTVEEKL